MTLHPELNVGIEHLPPLEFAIPARSAMKVDLYNRQPITAVHAALVSQVVAVRR